MSAAYDGIPSTTLADLVGPDQVMAMAIHSLWEPAPRLAGPAFTVRCPPGDNLMLHAAIHRAAPGTVIVVDAGADEKFAVAGGNVCAVAQGRGVAGFVVDGVIRDIGEVRDHRFPVFARGLSPIPGGKAVVEPLNGEITCGGVTVNAGDIVVADEEGIVVVRAGDQAPVLAHAKATLAAESNVTLDAWEDAHRTRIDRILRNKGYQG